ncbi:MAG: lipoyl synthase [Nanoarchaeota archaeon]
MEKRGIVVKPEWLMIRPSLDTDFSSFKAILQKRGLSTVCQEAHCPNMAECWHQAKTATFMVLGDTCTRTCRFCAIAKATQGKPLDPDEPRKLAEAIAEMNLDYAVITSVDRDDLPDGGADHFAACIKAIRQQRPSVRIEVLIPDFSGSEQCLKKIVEARPDVIGHNIETVSSLQKKVRDLRAGYLQSLSVLSAVKRLGPKIFTKSSLILGLGESKEEVIEAMQDLRKAGCDILTLGQYLKPKNRSLEVEEFITPDAFAEYRRIAEELGFLFVASGPFVRSSYRAGELFMKSQKPNHDHMEVGLSQET